MNPTTHLLSYVAFGLLVYIVGRLALHCGTRDARRSIARAIERAKEAP